MLNKRSFMKDKIINLYNLVNSIEVKGAQNIMTLYKIFAILQEMNQEIEENKDEKEE